MAWKYKNISKFYKFIIFINFFKNFWKKKLKEIPLKKNKNKILIEYYPFYASLIPFSTILYTLLNRSNSEIICYKISLKKRKFSKLKDKIKLISPFSYESIYKSFGVKNFIRPNFNEINNLKEEKKIKKIFNKIKSKEKLLKLRVNKILIGDLLYDSYLRNNSIATIQLDSKEFENYFRKFLKLFFFWKDYFNKNKINSIITSHQVYEYGLPSRIAVTKKILCLQASLSFLYKFSEKNLSLNFDQKNYKKTFMKFSKDKKKRYIKLGAQFLINRFNKNYSFDPRTNSENVTIAFDKSKIIRKKNKHRKIKVLIASHCLDDAPHVYGNFLFNDIYEWLEYLFKISKKTNYEWYVKIHPQNYKKDYNLMRDLIKKYPSIKIIKEKTSMNQIINSGITHALSIYGSVGYELPYHGIPVIFANPQYNPFNNFSFNINCKNKKEYENKIMNLKKLKINFNRREIYIYSFMRFLYIFNSFFENYYPKSKIYGQKLFTPEIFDQWFKTLDNKKFIKLTNKLDKIIFSNKSGMLV